MDVSQATMDGLLAQYRGEMAAIEAYDPAIGKFANQPEEPVLRKIQAEHRVAVRRLAAAIHRHGGVVPEGSGAWGTLTTTVESLAGLINDEVPLQVLYHGEAIGCGGYAKLRAEPGLPGDLAQELAELAARCQRPEEALAAIIHDIPESPTRPLL